MLIITFENFGEINIKNFLNLIAMILIISFLKLEGSLDSLRLLGITKNESGIRRY